MGKIDLGKSGISAPSIGLGCMRIADMSHDEMKAYIDHCLSLGLNFFDHADIYGGGKCEEIFGNVLKETPSLREQMTLQSKCAIVPGVCYNHSKDYILNSVDGILSRLNTEYIDFLLLHRPDALCEPEEVAEAFDILENSGKVKHFGVSNHKSSQIKLLQKYVKQPISVNQMQLSLVNATLITQGTHVNMEVPAAYDLDDSTLDFCRLEDITIQTWSPFQALWYENNQKMRGTFIGNENFPALNQKLDELAEKYNVSNTTIALAWILRHPAKMQAIVGTTNLDRITECANASKIMLTREEWYQLYMAAGNTLP